MHMSFLGYLIASACFQLNLLLVAGKDPFNTHTAAEPTFCEGFAVLLTLKSVSHPLASAK